MFVFFSILLQMTDPNTKILSIHTPTPKFRVLEEIQKRFSPRFYSSEPIADNDIQRILEAARWTPSGHNDQPWFFYVVKKTSSQYQSVFTTLNDYNQSWAKTAPLLVVACAIVKNDHGENIFARYDLGASVISLILQAQSMGIYSRQIGLFDADQIKKILNLETNLIPFTVVAMGKIGDYSNAPKEILEMENEPRPRKQKIFEILE